MTIATGERMYAADITDLTFFPIGTILQFSGSEYTRLTAARTKDNNVIWTLCNGISVNGIAVPNLVDKFLRGGSVSGGTGGIDSYSKIITAANLPNHSHPAGSLLAASDGTHSHGITDPGHKHKIPIGANGSPIQSAADGLTRVAWFDGIESSKTGITIQNDGAHTHSVSGHTGVSGGADNPTSITWDNKPPYYTLVYLMKVA